MITLLASLAWADDPPADVKEGGNDGARIAFATLSGAAAGGMGGLVIGAVIGGVVIHTAGCDTTDGDCNGGGPAGAAGIGLIVGGITGGIVGGVTKANKLKRDRVALVPLGPVGPGLTLVGRF